MMCCRAASQLEQLLRLAFNVLRPLHTRLLLHLKHPAAREMGLHQPSHAPGMLTCSHGPPTPAAVHALQHAPRSPPDPWARYGLACSATIAVSAPCQCSLLPAGRPGARPGRAEEASPRTAGLAPDRAPVPVLAGPEARHWPHSRGRSAQRPGQHRRRSNGSGQGQGAEAVQCAPEPAHPSRSRPRTRAHHLGQLQLPPLHAGACTRLKRRGPARPARRAVRSVAMLSFRRALRALSACRKEQSELGRSLLLFAAVLSWLLLASATAISQSCAGMQMTSTCARNGWHSSIQIWTHLDAADRCKLKASHAHLTETGLRLVQDGVDDRGWGCAYRSLQTISSWYRAQGFTSAAVPSHKDMQLTLVKLGGLHRPVLCP